MSVVMHLATENVICPACGHSTIKHIELWDKEFGKRNDLPMILSDVISDDGLFELQVCTTCGFKWIRNSGVASTSQVKSRLMSFYIEKFSSCDMKELRTYINDLAAVAGSSLLKVDKDGDALRLALLGAVDKHLSDCGVPDLVEIYNSVFKSTIEDLVDPDVQEREILVRSGDKQHSEQIPRALTTDQVISDD